jgi:hypothetical protein
VGTVSDDFNRADGGLGGNWTRITGGTSGDAPVIASNKAQGFGNLSGALRSAESFANDQSASVEAQASLPSGGWIGAVVRGNLAGTVGDNIYVGIYFFTDPSYVMQLYKRVTGSFTQLTNLLGGGDTIGLGSSPVAAGTVFKVDATGTTITFSKDGVAQIQATDSAHASGAPGIMFAKDGALDNWLATGGPGSPRFRGVVIV